MSLQENVEALGVLVEPQRRRVLEHVQTYGPCTVAELVSGLGMGRTLVAFHLAKLVDAGFAEVVQPQRAPGARGRPAQRYRATGREVAVSVPDRRYDLLAGVLLDSLAQHQPGESAHASALRAARRWGRELSRSFAGGPATRRAGTAFTRLEPLLVSLGYVPRRQDDELVVRNCPFHRFRQHNTEQVCSLNLALADGYLDGLGIHEMVDARLRPCPDTCCVVFEPTAKPRHRRPLAAQ